MGASGLVFPVGDWGDFWGNFFCCCLRLFFLLWVLVFLALGAFVTFLLLITFFFLPFPLLRMMLAPTRIFVVLLVERLDVAILVFFFFSSLQYFELQIYVEQHRVDLRSLDQ